MARDFTVFALLRLLSVFLIQSAYVPDEYWQSLEVSHYLSFGYGYLTWEWQEGLRSYTYPLIFSCVYKVLGFLNLDYVKLVILAPRIVQALFTAYADVCLLRWFRDPVYGRAPWAKITLVSSWYLFYVGSRTLYNTAEADLLAIALSLYPWPQSKDSDSCKFLLWGSLACMIRPTAALILAPLCLYQLARSSKRLLVFFKYLMTGVFTAAFSISIDSFFQKEWTLSPLNFFKTNVLKGIGSFYGEHPGLWYIFQGIPMMLGIQTLPFIYELYHIIRGPSRKAHDVLMMVVFFTTVFLYSLQPHKETRFLLSILPIALFWTAGGLSRFERNSLKNDSRRFRGLLLRLTDFLPWILLITSALPSLYFGVVHQRGTIDAVSWLSSRAAACPRQTNILFLMPCHSTPLYSHLHVNVPTRILTCVPNLREGFDNNYKDETNSFYSDQAAWLSKNYPEIKHLPSHIVFFDCLKPQLDSFLQWGGYTKAVSFFHTHFPSERVGSNIFIMQRDAALTNCSNV